MTTADAATASPPKSSKKQQFKPKGAANKAGAGTTDASNPALAAGSTDSVGKRVSRPDADAYKAKMAALTKDIDVLMAKQTEVKQKLPAPVEKGAKTEQGPRKELADKIDAVRQTNQTHQTARKALLDQIVATQAVIKRKGEEIKSSKDKLAFKSVAEIDRRLAEMEAQVSSGMMKLVEEKRMLSDMTSLRKQRKTVDAFGSQESSIDADKKKLDALRAQLTTLDPEGKRLKTELDQLYTQLKAMDAERAKDYGKVKSIYAERDELQKKLTVLFDQKRALHAEFKQQQDQWFVQVREDRARRDLERRQEQAEYEKRKKLETVQRAREMAELPAFESELATCNALIFFLNTLMGNSPLPTGTANGDAATKAGAAPVRQVTDNAPKGVELKKKSDRMDDDTMMFMGSTKKKSSGNNKKETTSASASSLKFDLAVMSQFLALNVTVPSKISDVPAALEALKKKVEFFLENQERVTKENVAKAKALEEKVLKSLAEMTVDAAETKDESKEVAKPAAAEAEAEPSK